MQEQSGIQLNKPTQSLDSEHGSTPQSSRRKFLTKASVGIVVASLPARSVWASGGGVAQSIVASGHGSDFAEGKCIQLLSHGWWKNQCGQLSFLETKFQTVFGYGNKPFVKPGKTGKTNPTLKEVLSNESIYDSRSFQIICMYLNAKYNGRFGLVYPIYGTGRPFATLQAFANYLYSKAKNDTGFGETLGQIIDQYHVGKFGLNCTK